MSEQAHRIEGTLDIRAGLPCVGITHKEPQFMEDVYQWSEATRPMVEYLDNSFLDKNEDATSAIINALVLRFHQLQALIEDAALHWPDDPAIQAAC